MMVRIKWLLIGFFAGAAVAGAGARHGAPSWMKMGGGGCCGAEAPAAGDAAGPAAPDEGAAA
jgi:hypothetical protein